MSSHTFPTQLPHTKLVHAQLVLTPLAHAQLAPTQLVLTQLVHTQLVITPLARTQLVLTHVLTGVALGDIYLHFAWQAWHLATCIFTFRGKRGTW